MLPPEVGYNTEVLHGAMKTLSTFNLANLNLRGPKRNQSPKWWSTNMPLFGRAHVVDSHLGLTFIQPVLPSVIILEGHVLIIGWLFWNQDSGLRSQ